MYATILIKQNRAIITYEDQHEKRNHGRQTYIKNGSGKSSTLRKVLPREKVYPGRSLPQKKSNPRAAGKVVPQEKVYPEKESTLEKIHNSCPIFMKHGENVHLMSTLSFSNISLIGSKLWIFSGVDFFLG